MLLAASMSFPSASHQLPISLLSASHELSVDLEGSIRLLSGNHLIEREGRALPSDVRCPYPIPDTIIIIIIIITIIIIVISVP